MIEDFFSRVLQNDQTSQREARVPGLVYAEVAGVNDDGTFALTFTSTESTERSAPARLATLMAGNQRGSIFRPEVGDEVVVGFELGNINRPVILGALHSDQDKEPDGADTSSTNNLRMLVSRSKHKITFDDSSESAGKLTITSAGGLTIEMDDGGKKLTIKTSGGLSIEMDDNSQKITVKTSGAVATSQLTLDNVSWNHQHATGTGPSGPPVSIGG